MENQSNRGRASCEGGRLEQRKMWSEMAAPLSSRPDPLMIEHSFSSVGDGGAGGDGIGTDKGFDGGKAYIRNCQA